MTVFLRLAAAVTAVVMASGFTIAGASAWGAVLVPSSTPGLLSVWTTDYPIHYDDMEPGDQAFIALMVELDDTDAGDLSLQVRKDGELATMPGGLSIDIDRCDLPWNDVPGGISVAATTASPTCDLGEARLLSATASDDFRDDSPTWDLGVISRTALIHLLVRVSIPDTTSLVDVEDRSATFAFGLFAEGEELIVPTAGGPGLAFTGIDAVAIAMIAGGAIGVGLVLVLVRRREVTT
jgi:hypothetical protein